MNSTEKYTEGSDMQQRDAREVIEEFSDELSKMKGRCIDIGCGPGNVTYELILPKLGADAFIVGADICEEMLDYARKKYNNEKRVSFIHMDIEAEELPKSEYENYENLLSFYCLHWCQNMRRTIENIYKLLQPGGRGLVMFLSYNNGFDAYMKLQKNPRYQPYMEDVGKYIPPYHSCPNPRATMKKTLEEVGFEVLHCSNREKTFVYESLEILQKHIVAVNPFINRIPDDLKAEYETEVTKEITKNKILFECNNGQSNGYSILDRYGLLIAYFRKPVNAQQVYQLDNK